MAVTLTKKETLALIRDRIEREREAKAVFRDDSDGLDQAGARDMYRALEIVEKVFARYSIDGQRR